MLNITIRFTFTFPGRSRLSRPEDSRTYLPILYTILLISRDLFGLSDPARLGFDALPHARVGLQQDSINLAKHSRTSRVFPVLHSEAWWPSGPSLRPSPTALRRGRSDSAENTSYPSRKTPSLSNFAVMGQMSLAKSPGFAEIDPPRH